MQENTSTLSYASLAQRISNIAVINEDPKTKLIKQLKTQVKFLLEQLKHSNQNYVANERNGFESSLYPNLGDSANTPNNGSELLVASPVVSLLGNHEAMRELIDDNNELRHTLESQANQAEQREVCHQEFNFCMLV